MGDGPALDGILERFASRLQERYRITHLILFGSRAEGRAAADSDYDFIIVSPDFEGVPWLKRLPDLHDYWDAAVGLDVLCYTPAEFEKLTSQVTMVRGAARRGIHVI